MRDFSQVETIYTQLSKTVVLRLRPDFVAQTSDELPVAGSPNEVYAILKAIYATLDEDQEHFVLLIANSANEITGYKLIASGGQNYTHVDLRVLFRAALLLGATRIVVAHNHPNRDPAPTLHDVQLTHRIVEAGRLLDIELLDHMIYTTRGFGSVRELRPELFETPEGMAVPSSRATE